MFFPVWMQTGFNKLKTSRLYNLQPIGVGTLWVESLTSYMARLAKAHSISTGTLITKELASILGKDYILNSAISGGSRFYESACPLNGVGKYAEEFVGVLEKLTLRNDLQYLTLLPWREIIPQRQLLHKTRKWCPVCFEEWRDKNEVIYEPLIWNIKLLKNCPKHGIELEYKCANCKKENYIINRKFLPGFCSKCNYWLGSSHKVEHENKLKYDEKLWFDFVLINIEQLMKYPYTFSLVTEKNSIGSAISMLIQQNADNIAEFAKLVNLPKSNIWMWRQGKSKPEIKSLFYLCYTTGLNVIDLVMRKNLDVDYVNINFIEINNDLKKKKQNLFDKDKIKRVLEQIIENSSNISLRGAARQLGYDKGMLYEYFPELCKKISENYIFNQRERKKQRIEETCLRVRIATLGLAKEGIYPSRRKVEELLISKGGLREREVQKAWKNTLSRQ